MCRLCVALLLFGISIYFYRPDAVCANALPMDMQLGAAITSAVEADVEQEDNQQINNNMDLDVDLDVDMGEQLWRKLIKKDTALDYLFVDTDTTLARGQFHKRRKFLKYLYPLIVAIAVAKTILIPLLLKLLTALSASSFAMSKMALMVAGVLLLKWLFAGPPDDRKHLEIVHLPAIKTHYTNTGGTGGDGGLWHDLYTSGSNPIDSKTKSYFHKYIPVVKDADNSAYDGSPFL